MGTAREQVGRLDGHDALLATSRAQNLSVSLARQRQAALEARAQAARDHQTRNPRPPAQQGHQTSPNTPQPASPLPASAPPLPKSPPGGSGGADRAIAFAKAQLGDP